MVFENISAAELAAAKARKPVVLYRDVSGAIRVGSTAVVRPVDHPSGLVSNTQMARTSEVLHHSRATGEFETRNTIYRPVDALAPATPLVK